MPTKAQHSKAYRPVPELLKRLREEAGLTQRGLGVKLKKPQSWIYNCESGNRRVDIAEFAAWATACGVESEKAFRVFLRA
jgi:transcriptional regulator with XRE-family HTH domain